MQHLQITGNVAFIRILKKIKEKDMKLIVKINSREKNIEICRVWITYDVEGLKALMSTMGAILVRTSL